MSGEWEVTAKWKPKNRLERLVERVQQLRRLRQGGLEDLNDAATRLNAANDEIKQLETDKQTLLCLLDDLSEEVNATRLRADMARNEERWVSDELKVSRTEVRKLEAKLKRLRAKK